MIKKIKEIMSILKREWAGAFTLMLCAFIGSCTANLITGCAQLSRVFPETTKEAATVSPELREVADKKGVKVIRKGKAEAVKKVEKL